MFRRLFQVILIWYAIWFLVGLVAVAIPYESPVGHWEDLLFMILASAVIFFDAARRIGWGATIAYFIWIAAVSGGMEMLGAMTGLPFGAYAYTDNFGPRIAGILPWAIPLAWWVVLYPLLLLMNSMVRNKREPRPGLIALGVAICATGVDLALEPVATIVREYWIWESTGAYYGVPLLNFFGWFITAWIIVFPLQYFMGRILIEGYIAPGAMFLPFAALGSVLASFLIAGMVHGLWLASAWTAFLTLLVTVIVVRFAWPRREVFMMNHQGRYRPGYRPRKY
ncbi:carotenoid biosynthesis protein [Cerasicoccus frondis]|uniref:carotenoid biosynthesis protein n=1 Tax=Cerasicoccus frondis TaxID=490090 RepID=UPI002852BF56|nr:carotenoid biosynthesis protein [Cerasicoccus frondis]